METPRVTSIRNRNGVTKRILHRLAALGVAAGTAFAFLVAAGAGHGGRGVTAEAAVAQQNPPFHNYLTVDIQQNSTFDAVRTSVRKIAVTSWSGKRVTLNVRQTPVLLEAYWCPHCQRTLRLLQAHQSSVRHMPQIVATGYAKGTTLTEARALFLDEERGLLLRFPVSRVYFLLNDTEVASIITMFPQLYFEQGHRTETMMGEHTWLAWDRVFH